MCLRVKITGNSRVFSSYVVHWLIFSLLSKDQAMAFEDLKKTMETTRAHLQNQYRTKEMENNRLQVQIRVGFKLFSKFSKVL